MQESAIQTFTRADYTLEEYERAAEQSEFKLEYYEGQIIMSSPTNFHAEIIASILIHAGQAVRNSGARIYADSPEIRPLSHPEEHAAVFRPDVVVHFPESGIQNVRFVSNPLAIIEVLSESTADLDRGPKFRRCARIPELKHYVLVSQEAMRVEHRFRPEFAAEWETHELAAPEDRLVFPEAGFDLSLAQMYEDIPLG